MLKRLINRLCNGYDKGYNFALSYVDAVSDLSLSFTCRFGKVLVAMILRGNQSYVPHFFLPKGISDTVKT